MIRHGETPSNAARIFQTPETPLSDRGVAQAECLAARLRHHPVGLVLASDLERAHQTARIVVTECGAPLELEPLLHERNFGDLRGTAYADVQGDPFGADFAPPAGETWAQFHERVDRAWDAVLAVAQRCDGDLVVVTHGLVCGALLDRKLAAGSATQYPEMGTHAFANTSITIASGSAPWTLERVGCIEHLSELEPTPEGARV
ncbi:MAG: histidine phosphatase family protein [Myxococcota bacterium]|nr:histidine phosphatase family protein [Myxococcota bacterium]